MLNYLLRYLNYLNYGYQEWYKWYNIEPLSNFTGMYE